MKILAALLLALVMAAAQAAGPQQFELVYRFLFNGQYVGSVTDRFSREGNQYRLSSEAVPDGPLALLLPMLTLSSEGELDGARFVPRRYRQARSNAPGKTAVAEFDWQQKRLTHQYKGRRQQTALPEGAQDALTQLYAFTLAGTLPPRLEFAVSNGRRLLDYRYQKFSGARLDTPLGSFETTEYRRIADAPGDNAISVWIAPALHHLPVRIRVREETGVFEQQLIRLDYQGT